ncbi:putative signal-transducing adaptor protein 2-like isoform 2 [Scophthalmus maximus]|uniref:Putative signal-transducing adaptor protein 2-like isoform 2 n=1 Tax=Scophthalmus maximus TaxID=52904 RepID=A0A2U9C6I3_SCOMX|nr:signal-transducing adaptor protein 2 isoform X2 [Scophthalmus maximus]AWP11346.1 putative signal-transducing adaptor protein 2-like isoform 2 [Scophthalmus maximus]
MARRTGRQRSQLPTCYYEGYLEKRSFKDKTSRKLWTCLCGNMLFFFNEKRDADYIEKVDLRGMISVTDDSSLDRNLDAARIILKMQDGNIKFTAPNTEARELWKGYILSVSELSVPPSLNLLPGQFHMLQEAVDKETERLKHVDPPEVTSSPYINLQVNFPPVSRLEAELLLEKECKRGNMLLRPGSKGTSFSVTTRQDHDGAIFSHYRVTGKQEGGFSIDVDNPVPCATLSDVINHLVEKTDGALVPLIIEEEYEKNIFFIRSDNENGEKSVEQALSNPRRSLPPKPDTLKIKTPVRAPTPVEVEEKERETEEDPAAALSQQKKPPVPAPRKFTLSTSTHSATSSTNRDLRSRSHTDPLGQTISELKLKFGQKAKCPE